MAAKTHHTHSGNDVTIETVADRTPSSLGKRGVILAWSLFLLCVIGASVNLIAWLFDQSGRPTFFELVQSFGWNWALPVLFSALAALIIARQPGNRVGWLLILPALVTAASPQWLPAAPPAALTPGLWLLLWFDNWSWIPVIFPIFLIPLNFPTGHPPSPKWNWINWLAIGMWLFFMVLVSFFDTIGPINYEWVLPNPIGFIPIEVTEGPILIVWGIGLVTVVSASVVSLFVRYRRARAVERQQIKWLLYTGAFFVVVYTVVYFVSDSEETGFASGWADLMLLLSILAFPVAIAVAILRYRLWDIDVIIRKTLVYTVLTGLLALTYFGSVLLLETVFGFLTGQESAIAIVISTLIIAALFSPLRRRVQGFIDRRFFRSKYNAEKTLAEFALTARDEVDLDRLTAELMRVVGETMQPTQSSLWLKTTTDGRQQTEVSRQRSMD
jgi:hypothetical protein